jgi:hypothetical protein
MALGYILRHEDGVQVLAGLITIVLCAKITAASIIFLSPQNETPQMGNLTIGNRITNTSFEIKSSHPLDGRSVAWFLYEL